MKLTTSESSSRSHIVHKGAQLFSRSPRHEMERVYYKKHKTQVRARITPLKSPSDFDGHDHHLKIL
jgi:hypothetical protein